MLLLLPISGHQVTSMANHMEQVKVMPLKHVHSFIHICIHTFIHPYICTYPVYTLASQSVSYCVALFYCCVEFHMVFFGIAVVAVVRSTTFHKSFSRLPYMGFLHDLLCNVRICCWCLQTSFQGQQFFILNIGGINKMLTISEQFRI